MKGVFGGMEKMGVKVFCLKEVAAAPVRLSTWESHEMEMSCFNLL